MATLKILSSKLMAGRPVDPGKPKGRKGRPVRLTVVAFSLTAPGKVHVRMNKNESVASLIEITEPGRERGQALHDELARTPEGGGPPGGQGRP